MYKYSKPHLQCSLFSSLYSHHKSVGPPSNSKDRIFMDFHLDLVSQPNAYLKGDRIHPTVFCTEIRSKYQKELVSGESESGSDIGSCMMIINARSVV